MQELENDSERLLDGVDFIYPACDLDFFALRNPLHTLKGLVKFKRSISISTKARLSSQTVSSLAKINELLRNMGCFLKISCSFSTKFSVARFEAGAASFQSRLENLGALTARSVPNSAIIKPVLPEVGIDEYIGLVDSVSTVTKHLVLGRLYLDEADERLKTAPNLVDFKKVRWATGIPSWPCIESANKISAIATHAGSIGMGCFDSDLAFMECLKLKLNCNGEIPHEPAIAA